MAAVKAVHIVVHPLDDAPEEKVDLDSLGPMQISLAVRVLLCCLQVYAVLMAVLLAVHVAVMARQ